jgi:hypothetical protein
MEQQIDLVADHELAQALPASIALLEREAWLVGGRVPASTAAASCR